MPQEGRRGYWPDWANAVRPVAATAAAAMSGRMKFLRNDVLLYATYLAGVSRPGRGLIRAAQDATVNLYRKFFDAAVRADQPSILAPGKSWLVRWRL